jgi:uncharacterized protein (DUF433 family)
MNFSAPWIAHDDGNCLRGLLTCHGLGAPTLVGTSTRTTVLADYVKAEGGNVAKVAAWFELPLAGVQAAVDFERSIAP